MSLDYVTSEEIFRGRKRVIFRATLEKDARAAIVKTLSAEHPSKADITIKQQVSLDFMIES